jgi:hypothetical protein
MVRIILQMGQYGIESQLPNYAMKRQASFAFWAILRVSHPGRSNSNNFNLKTKWKQKI